MLLNILLGVFAHRSVSRQPGSVNNSLSVKKAIEGGFELHRMAEHLGPSSSTWNPRADKQIKCGTAGEDRRESFKQISTHVEARGLTNVCMCQTLQRKKTVQTSVWDTFPREQVQERVCCFSVDCVFKWRAVSEWDKPVIGSALCVQS